MKTQVNEIKEGLQHFHGTEMFYQIPLLRTRFTDGLKYLANVADMYTDGNDTVLEKQYYRVTDFPLDELRLFFVNDTLMLPGEY